MVFPDYYFFAERRLENHPIEKKRVKNLDDCELMCYLNDDCVTVSHFFICDFIDIDECKGNHSCHENANCTNTNGSHVCDCQPGYTGNGQNCTGEFGIARKCGHG